MTALTRRRFLQHAVGAGVALTAPWTLASGARAAPGAQLEKYVQPLPVPGAGIVVAAASGLNTYAFTQTEIARQLHPRLPATPLWAYDDGSGLAGQAGSFGMAIVAHTGTPIDVSFTSDLPESYPAWLPVDTRLTPRGTEVRVMTHLHGGFVAADSDGNPAITPNGFFRGETQHVTYPNEAPQQPATLMWFHDHAMGATRLNVFAGLAAAYILRDEHDTGLEPNPIGIPGGAYEVPLVIQDRQFNADGTMRYPAEEDIPGVTWIGEYFGDVMLVNGKVWPFLDVEPRLYRFRVLNGCNARILELTMSGVPLWQIGADGGMWDAPVRISRMVLAPAERADVLADFRGLAGKTLTLKNGRPGAPVVTPAPPLTSVMQLRVRSTAGRPGPTGIPASLPGRAAQLPAPAATRHITLNELGVDTARWVLTLNGRRFERDVTETPRVGAVEDWMFINLTGDTHPMHTHLFTHQVVARRPFDAAAYMAAAPAGPDGGYEGIDPRPFYTSAAPLAPDPAERGFKDTTKANPGQVTIIRARFDLPTSPTPVTAPQTYVQHCHIVEHEDNDMMRPFTVMP